jgi:tRNA(fMet)-specific endonuclease VapC
LRYLLDTNILSALVRDPKGAIARRIAKIGEARICTSVIVAAELRCGVAKKHSDRLLRQVNLILDALEILPWESPSDRFYGELRAQLEWQGQPIGANELLIAAHALMLQATLVTDNEREFGRVPGLILENWLR